MRGTNLGRRLTLISMVVWALAHGHAFAEGGTTPGEVYSHALRKFQDIKTHDVVRGFEGHGLESQLRRSRFSNQSVRVASNISERSLSVAGVQINFEKISSLPSIREYCKHIESNRQNPKDSDMGLLVLDFRWLEQLRNDPVACRSERGQFLFLEVPIGVQGMAILTKSTEQFPLWITPQHFAVASLESIPEGSAATLGPIVSIGKECVALEIQPAPEQLQDAIYQAECITIGSDGKRKVGEHPTRHLPARYTHAAESHQDFLSVFYRYPRDNNFTYWNYYDDGLAGHLINLHVMEGSSERALIRNLCAVLPDANGDWRQSEIFFDTFCKWRDTSLYQEYLSEDSIARIKYEDSAVVYLPIGAYVRKLLADYSGSFSDMTPMTFSQAPGIEDRPAVEAFRDAILAGEYPLARIVWVYVDPALFARSSSAVEFMYKLLSDGSSDGPHKQVEDDILFFGQLSRIQVK